MPAKTAARKRSAAKKSTRKRAAAAKKSSPRPRARATARRQVTDEHKQAMLAGRTEGSAVRRYLEALRAEQAPKRRGRRRTPEQMQERIDTIAAALSNGVDPMKELELRQERLHLISDLQETQPKATSEEHVDEFVKHAKSFGERKGYAYEVWRELGVPTVVLQKAGIKR